MGLSDFVHCGWLLHSYCRRGVRGSGGNGDIKFGTSALSPTMAGVWMAKESGAFERRGINAELVYISSGAVVVRRWSAVVCMRRWARVMR